MSPEVLVGICVEDSIEMIIGLLGILKAGGAYLQLDPDYSPEYLTDIICDSQVHLLLADEKSRSILPESKEQIICLDQDSPIIANYSSQNIASLATSASLAYVVYTSESEEKPKGVEIEHRYLTNFIQWSRDEYKIDQSDRVLQFYSISFNSPVDEIYPCLLCGGTLVLRNEQMLSSVSTFIQTCEEWGITVLNLPTPYWQQIIAELDNSIKKLLPDSLRLIIIGGERVLKSSVKSWQEVVGISPQLINTYRPIDGTVIATSLKITPSVTIQQYLLDVLLLTYKPIF